MSLEDYKNSPEHGECMSRSLYEQDAIDLLIKQRDDLNELCKFNENTMNDLLKHRDELLAQNKALKNALTTEWIDRVYWCSARDAVNDAFPEITLTEEHK